MKLALLGLFLTPLALHAQACTARALRMIEDSKMNWRGGNAAAAEKALEGAADQCPDSCDVFSAIAREYRAMGNHARANKYAGYAGALGCKTLPAAIPIGPAPEPPVLRPAPRPDLENFNSYVRQKWALVVGIGQFQRPEVPSLRYAAKDACDFANTLTDPNIGRFPPDSVQLLRDEQATVENIRTAINRIAIKAQAEDLVVLYFSTHGSSADMDAATDQGRTGYIVAYNTDVRNLYATAFPMDEMKRVVDTRLKAGRVITLLDTCYSGDTVRHGGSKALTVNIPSDSIAKIAQGKGRVVIASSRSNEQSWESDTHHNSYFTYYLMQAMRQNHGLATITDLYKQLQLSVPGVVLREKHAEQNPVMFPEGGKINIVIGTAVQ